MPPDKVPVPSDATPSLKVTVPVGVPDAGDVAETVAVKVTDCPNTLGLSEGATVVVVAPWLTVCVTGADVLPVRLLSPG